MLLSLFSVVSALLTASPDTTRLSAPIAPANGRSACVSANITNNAQQFSGMSTTDVVIYGTAQLQAAGWIIYPLVAGTCNADVLVSLRASAVAIEVPNVIDSTVTDTVNIAFGVMIQENEKFQLLTDSQHWYWASMWDYFGTWTTPDVRNARARMTEGFDKYLRFLINHENGQDNLNP